MIDTNSLSIVFVSFIFVAIVLLGLKPMWNSPDEREDLKSRYNESKSKS